METHWYVVFSGQTYSGSQVEGANCLTFNTNGFYIKKARDYLLGLDLLPANNTQPHGIRKLSNIIIRSWVEITAEQAAEFSGKKV